MKKIEVELPQNRDYAGRLRVKDARGRTIAGPFEVCARSCDEVALANRNPTRDPVLPGGDTPAGFYRVASVLRGGTHAIIDRREFGSAGIVALEPSRGDAALADANGRFQILIHGGARGGSGRLRPADGSLRLSDSDQRRLVRCLESADPIECECVTVPRTRGRQVALGSRPSACSKADRIQAMLAGTARQSGGAAPRRRRLGPPSFIFSHAAGAGGGGSGGDGGGDDSYSDGESQTPQYDSTGQIDAATGVKFTKTAADVVKDYKKNRITYPKVDKAPLPPGTADCSSFVRAVLSDYGISVPNLTTHTISAKNSGFVDVTGHQRPGDIVLIPPPDEATSGHMGIYTGTTANGIVNGLEMGKSGPGNMQWNGPSQPKAIKFYRYSP